MAKCKVCGKAFAWKAVDRKWHRYEVRRTAEGTPIMDLRNRRALAGDVPHVCGVKVGV